MKGGRKRGGEKEEEERGGGKRGECQPYKNFVLARSRMPKIPKKRGGGEKGRKER